LGGKEAREKDNAEARRYAEARREGRENLREKWIPQPVHSANGVRNEMFDGMGVAA
jgi:hypothetical protein